MRRFLSSQGFVTLTVVTTAVTLVLGGYALAFRPFENTIAYCAILPDSVGLYPGNHVTTLGLTIGEVTDVRPHNGAVRVQFAIDADRELHGDVIATTISDTLVADRDLAVLDDQDSPNAWNPDSCITKAVTPKSISETLESFATLAAQLDGHGDPANQQQLRDSIRAFQQETSGSGPSINKLIVDLGRAVQKPDADIGHLGSLIDAFAALVSSIAINWADIEATLDLAYPGITFVNEIWQRVVQIVDSLEVILPWLNDIARQYGHPILDGIDELAPSLRMLAANVGSIRQLIDMIPLVSTAFRQAVDAETGAVRLEFTPPRVALPTAEADSLCAAINAASPGRCRSGADGLADIDLVTLVLGLVGA